MRTALITAVGIAAVVLAIAVSATPARAAAPITDDYRTGMQAFIGDLGDWADNVSVAAEAARVKPELGCSDEMVELARISGWLVDDLRGTGRLAPASIRGSHTQLTQSVAQIGAYAEAACGNAVTSADAIKDARVGFDSSLARIASFVRYGPGAD